MLKCFTCFVVASFAAWIPVSVFSQDNAAASAFEAGTASNQTLNAGRVQTQLEATYEDLGEELAALRAQMKGATPVQRREILSAWHEANAARLRQLDEAGASHARQLSTVSARTRTPMEAPESLSDTERQQWESEQSHQRALLELRQAVTGLSPEARRDALTAWARTNVTAPARTDSSTAELRATRQPPSRARQCTLEDYAELYSEASEEEVALRFRMDQQLQNLRASLANASPAVRREALKAWNQQHQQELESLTMTPR